MRKCLFVFIKKFFLTFLFLLSSLFVSAQVLERSVISAWGANNSTAGETAITTVTDGTIVLTQGFQQPVPEDFTGTINIDNGNIDFVIYPNPALNYIRLKFNSNTSATLVLNLYDISGKLLYQTGELSLPENITHNINMSDYQAGTYFLLVKDTKGNPLKNFKIVKTK